MTITGLKGFHLSLQQAQVWSFQGDQEQVPAIGCALQISGTLDEASFLHAAQWVMDQQSIMRTTFFLRSGMDRPIQVPHEQMASDCEIIDITKIRVEDQADHVQRSLILFQSPPLNLTQGPLFHLCLLRLASDHHILLLQAPILCADERTLRLYVTELSQAYARIVGYLPAPNEAEEPLRYVDVAAWQDDFLQEEKAEHQRQYWQQMDLSRLLPNQWSFFEAYSQASQEIRRDQPDATFTPQMLDLPLDAQLLAQITTHLDRYQVSLEAYLLACWSVSWAKIQATTHLVLGLVCDGRWNEELHTALGLYHRMVPFAVDLPDDLPFEQVLRLVQAQVAQARENHLAFSWEQVSSPEHSHVFPLSFDYECWPEAFSAGPVTFSVLPSWGTMDPVLVQLRVRQVGAHVHLALLWDDRWLTQEHVKRCASFFQTILTTVTQQPQAALGTLSLLSPNEQAQQVAAWSAPARTWPMLALHQLFERQVQRDPDQLAVSSRHEHLTYRHVNEQANRLAQVLRLRGVGPEVVVGLALPRQATMIVGLLAILKAGGAYLPLDLANPPARVSQSLHESGASLLLTQEAGSIALPDWTGQILAMHDLAQELAQASTHDLEIPVLGDALAYVLYTSGSTGTPKGVMVRQSSVVNYTLGLCEQLGAESGWQYATVSTLAADLGNTAIFAALASGGCVQVLDYEMVTSGEALATWAEQHPIDVLKIVPSHLAALLESEWASVFLPRRALVVGGEAMSAALVERVRHLGGRCRIYNHYGPTETTIGVLVNPLQEVRQAEPIALGHPLANTQIVVLDAALQLVPPGVRGELYIAGEGLARGYLGQPGQTAERFVPNPWSTRGGERLYRTGDVVQHDQDGRLIFLGRRDGQVKIRGYRIELREIEAALARHPQVQRSVVLYRADEGREPQVVGYVVSRQRQPISRAELRTFLETLLPSYMIPEVILLLDAIPLTPNGKVDRRALPAPEQATEREALLAGPRGSFEEVVLGIWKEVLGVHVLGIHDNFFLVGGHSLLATRLIAQMRTLLNVEVPVQAVFEAPTVAEFAQRVEQALHHNEGVPMLPPLQVGTRPKHLPLSFAQQRLWFLDQLEPGSTAYLVPAAVQLTGEMRVHALQHSLQDMLERHESLRTTFVDLGTGEPVQVIHPKSSISLPLIDLQALEPALREEEARRLANQEAQQPYDLSHGLLLRSTLLRERPDEHVLLLTLHHIITDAWSGEIMLRELRTLYHAYAAGHFSPLVPLLVQYADYALWQRQWLQGKVLEAQLSYWRQQLANVSPLTLPTDHPRPAFQTHRGARQRWQIPLAITEGLRSLSQQQHTTLFMTLLASFQVLLMRYSGQDDISIGTPVANRRLAETDGMIGFFVNTLVLRGNFSGDPTFEEVLQQVREVCLNAYAHQDVPFEQIVEALEPERDLSRSPLFQVMFTLQQVSQEEPTEVVGVQLFPLSIENHTSQFDLALSVGEMEQGLNCLLQYNTGLFEAETMHRLLNHWQTLLEGVLHDPTMPIRRLPLLSVPEQAQILSQGRVAHQNASPSLSIHQLIEQQAAQTPDAVALTLAEEQMTYAELNRWANRLAHVLHTRGVSYEQRVGVCLPRSLDLIIGLLGIWKAGGVSVPLDPDYPAARQAFLLQDAQVKVLLTQDHLRPTTPAWEGPILSLEQEWNTMHQFPSHEPERVEMPLSLAYIVYTSGSTGQPKGAMIPHHGLGEVMVASIHAFGLGQQTRLLQHASMSFDNALWEIGMALVSGGTLCLQETMVIGDSLGQVLQQQAITTAILTPSVLATVPDGVYPALQTLLVGGERCSADLAQRWSHGRRFFNTYGPTETTIHATYKECIDASSLAPTIGRANAHCETFIFDALLQPVPTGVVGELSIGGRGVARGYVGRADQTAERFVPDPWSQEPGARLYRTGDMVRSPSSGEIEYMGRVDQQVKIHGVRIEPGETEGVLQVHPCLQEAVVVLREDQPGDKRLVAYVVAQPGQELTSREVRAFLQERLPAHLLPSAVVLLDAVPLTPNGKLDRRALPVPEALQQDDPSRFQEARTPLEELVRGLWSQVLGRAPIGLYENFFELGGHSLLAMQLIAQVRRMCAVELPVRTLFEAPTLVEFVQRIEQARRQDEGISMPPLLAGDRPDLIPLSFAQQRLWFLDQLDPGSTAYLVPAAVHITGEMRVRALQHSLQDMLERHESLRTTFADLGTGEPMQVIHSVGHISLPIIDLQALEPALRVEEARRLTNQEAQQPCDLSHGPLLRSALLRERPDEHVLLLTLHHIITDAWSGEIMLRELRTLYHAYASGHSSPLMPLMVQYADYALWQRQWLQGEVLDAQLSYWRQQLAGVPPLALPTDHPRPAIQTHRGTRQRWQVPLDLTEALHMLSQQQHVTLFMTLLASFQVLLLHYSGQDDISVGTPIANRRQAETDEVIGFFVNTLVLRSNLSGNPSFEEVLQRVREVCLGAYAHQDVPFEQIVEALEPTRDLSRSPLFQVLFTLLNMPQEEPTESVGVQLFPLSIENHTSQFDLTLSIEETEHGLHGSLEYNTDLFEAETIVRLLSHWQALLEGLVQHPQAPLSEISLLSANEQRQLHEHWNATRLSYPHEQCIHQLFEQQMQRTPDAIALVFEEEQVTYTELNTRADRLASHLQALGVGPDILVGVCLERSLEILIALLGVLKAGGAYVPLDPTYPQERLAFMIADARVSVLIHAAHTEFLLMLPPDVRQVSIQTLQKLGTQPYQKELISEVSSENLAYVIYTSGSTGRPKGTMVHHRSVFNFFQAMQQRLGQTHAGTWLAQTSISFDISVLELFWTLTRGFRVVIWAAERYEAQQPPVPDTETMGMQMQRQGVTHLQCTPSQASLLLEEPEMAVALGALEQILLGGEALPLALLRRVEGMVRGEIYNMYGPTETTIWSTMQQMEPEASRVLIGHPIANTQTFILDGQGHLAPVGVSGELYIGGVGVVRGYLQQPALTAERFVPDPWSQEPGARLYRTGDVARYHSNGGIECLGRLDQQVKIRGYRVEVGEIEAVLGKHPAIEKSVVVAREDQPGEKRLVAYLVAPSEHALTSREVRSFLQERLPAYLLPSAFVLLEALPLTPNGKVDRRALPAPEAIPESESNLSQQARTPLEELLLGLWSQTLGHQQIGLDENFFELGGHSLLAARLIGQVRKLLAVDLPLHTLFETPTIAGFARQVEQALRQNKGMTLPPLVAGTRPEALPLSFAQQRLWFLHQLEPDSTAYLLPSALHIKGTLMVQALERSVQQMIERHESLRTTFADTSTGEPMQVIHPAGDVSLPIIDLQGLLLQQREEEARRLTSQEAQQPCNMVRGPLLRLAIVRLQRDEHVLLLTLHHIITDGWSNGIFVRELTSLYQTFVVGAPSPLVPLTLHYADYALWQRQWLQGEVLENQLGYWRQQLAGAPPLALPTDYPRPAVQTHRGASQQWQIPLATTEALRILSQQQHVTLFMTLLASFQVLLLRYSGQRDISIGTPIANRQQAEVEGLIGFFVNTLVLRSDFSGNPSFEEVLQRVREVCLGAYAHQDVPFEQVVEAIEPTRDRSRSPLFQVLFTLQNVPHEESTEVVGVQISPLSVENHTSQFDLALTITETQHGLHCLMQYNIDLFEAETIVRMLGHWQQLIEGVVHA